MACSAKSSIALIQTIEQNGVAPRSGDARLARGRHLPLSRAHGSSWRLLACSSLLAASVFRASRQRRLAGDLCLVVVFLTFQAMMTVGVFAIKNSFGEHAAAEVCFFSQPDSDALSSSSDV